uniref:Uncharacterized protein n=1 Tax=viral metagenome TaxID=1070528 RepID=A0A6C0KU13_9ZZZZ
MTSKKVKIVKVPLAPELKSKNFPANFPNMPILYLELIENKGKIKPEFVNKEYIPKKKADLEFVDDEDDDNRMSPTLAASPVDSDRNIRENFSDQENEFDGGNEEDEDFGEMMEEDNFEENEPQYEEGGSRERTSGQSDISKQSSKHSQHSSAARHSRSSGRSEKRSIEIKKKGDKKISKRLKELLEESEDEREKPENNTTTYTAPSLKELEKSGKFTRKKEIEDVGHTNLSQQEEEDSKRELLFKFELLKKSYKADNIPEFTIHSDYHQMKKTYESTLRTLSLDKSVEDYKKYLIGGFMLLEFVCGNWLGFDMSGFTQQQIISMNSYEKLLIELGEKSYVPSGSKWPVEVRLLFLVIMNGAFFIISKMILKKTGSNLMNMMNSMNATTTAPTPVQMQKKRKMKGPSISVDDIPDVNDAEGSIADGSVAN